MTWWAAAVTAGAALAVFWGPGALVLRAWRRAGLDALAVAAVAPAVTVGVLAPAAVLLGGRVSWGPAAAAGAVVVVAGAGVGGRVAAAARTGAPVRGAASGPRARAARTHRGPLVVGVAVGVAAQLVPLAVGMRRADAFLAAHDVPFHLAALSRVRATGDGSSLTLMATAQVRDLVSGGFYAAGWHDVAVLVPRWPDPAVVANVVALVPAAVAWSVGLAYLTRVTWPARPRTWAMAPVLGAAGVASPVLLVLRPEGMVANAFALSLVPAVLGLVVAAVREPSLVPAAVLAAGGLGLVHPNAALTLVVVALPVLVGPAVAAARRHRGVAVLVVVGVVLATAVVAARVPVVSVVTSFPAEPPLAPLDAVLSLASGNATGAGWAGGPVVMLLGAVGAVLGRRLRGRGVLLGWAAVCVLYLAATSPVPWLTDVDRLWYGEPKRFAPMIGALAVPAAALALDALGRRARQEVTRTRWALRVTVALAVGLPALLTAAGLHDAAYRSSVPTADRPAAGSGAEVDMVRRLAGVLDPGRAVLGSPFAGTAELGERLGQRVVPASNVPTLDAEVAGAAVDVARLGSDPEVCELLERLGVGYLYVDAEPWNVVDGVPDLRTAPPRGVRLVDRGGSAAVYEVTAC